MTISALGRRSEVAAVAVLVGSVAVFFTAHALNPHHRHGDLLVYRLEAMALRHGQDIYGPLPGVTQLGTYPVFAVVVFLVLTLVPISPLQVLSDVGNLALLGYVAYASCRLLRLPARRAVLPAVLTTAAALWCEPVYFTFGYGQINLLLLALVLWDFTRAPGSRLRGVGTGLATALKVTPGILVVYLLLTRRFRAAGTAAAVFLGAQLVSMLADNRATWRYWLRYLFEPGRVGRPENAVNQSVPGVLVRIDHSRVVPGVHLGLVAVLLVVGLLTARLAYRRLGDEWGLPAAAVTGLLCSPIAWSHHWVWCVPIVVLLWFRARRWLVPTVAVFWSYAVWAVPHERGAELHFGWGQLVSSSWYVLFGLGFLAVTASHVLTAGTPGLRGERAEAPEEARSLPGVTRPI